MKNEPKRYTGTPVGGGERVEGQLYIDPAGKHILLTGGDINLFWPEITFTGSELHIVTPATVREIGVTPILKDGLYFCPDNSCREVLKKWWNFCPACGKALDWKKGR